MARRAQKQLTDTAKLREGFHAPTPLMAQTRQQPQQLLEQMRALCGQAGEAHLAQEPVNAATIHNWCDAMGDRNPIYYDRAVARAHGWPDIVSPPAMLNTWTMPGKVDLQNLDSNDPFYQCIRMCDSAGYSGTVATNSDHEYMDYVPLNARLHGIPTVTDVSDLKKTPLGTGYFISTNTDFYADDKLVGKMLFRVLKYQPNSGARMPAGMKMNQRPRPAISHDTAFFWEGLEQGELRIQKCKWCGALYHPPMVRCPKCGSYELHYQKARGTGTLYSFVEPCHPVLPFMRYPYVVGVVELSEGTRLITNIVNCPVAKLRIGMKLVLRVEKVDDELSLPLFEPDPPIEHDKVFKRRERTLDFSEVEVGDELPDWEVPITPTLIVTGALASRDYYEVHHDREAAQSRGAQDIFTNIMTTQGLCARYINDWVGPGGRFRELRTQLGVPNYPKDTLRIRAHVSDKKQDGKRGLITLALKGSNQMGDHVNATLVVELPAG